MGFNAKNLCYDSKEPPFLQRLRAEAGGRDSDRCERPLARPRKHRDPGQDDEDAPTYVDEESHDIVSRAELETLGLDGAKKSEVSGSSQNTSIKQTDENLIWSNASKSETAPSKEQIASIGGSSKKRAAKVIGGEKAQPPERLEMVPEGQDATKVKRKKGKRLKWSYDD